MTEVDLERLIKDWYGDVLAEGEELATAPTADCPPLTRLWQHYAEDVSLEEYEHHVRECARCQRVCEIIQRERARAAAGVPSARRPLYRVYRIGGALAAAACIALIFVSWPRPSFDAEIAAFGNAAYFLPDSSAIRGAEEGAPTPTRPEEPSWLKQALSDLEVQEAIGEQNPRDSTILLEIEWGRLRLDSDGRLGLAGGVDETTAEGDVLVNLIDQDREANERITDALMRHLPGVKEKNRTALQRALARYRAENVFGRSN